MGVEIERKFLVEDHSFLKNLNGEKYIQGYLAITDNNVSRIRITGTKAFLTIKGISGAISRLEFEYEIPVKDAEEMLCSICIKPLIEKTRYMFPFKGHMWEIDQFCGENNGLIIAEIELSAEDEQFEKPDWVGKEVSDDVRYYNFHLVDHPYCKWKQGGSNEQI